MGFLGIHFLCLVGCFRMIIWTPTVLSVLYACVLYLHLFSTIEHKGTCVLIGTCLLICLLSLCVQQYASALVQYKSDEFGGFDISEVEKEISRGRKLVRHESFCRPKLETDFAVSIGDESVLNSGFRVTDLKMFPKFLWTVEACVPSSFFLVPFSSSASSLSPLLCL